MLNSLLDGLQEVSGKVMSSGIVSRVTGAFFVVICLASGICLLITVMYLANPKGFDEWLSHALVENTAVAGTEETAEAEEGGEAEESAEAEEGGEAEESAEAEEGGEAEEVEEVEEVAVEGDVEVTEEAE
ncbi:MAG: hypothetical protein NOU37_03795 [Candidatus Brocadiales bacterium]|nr:hypothetical protein [Candidatus Bathyanammoxibius amoris]